MSISSVQTNLQPVENSAASAPPAAKSAPVEAADGAVQTNVNPPSSAPASSSAASFSTDLHIDDQHQVYYEVVDDRTGSELLEIPPETLRAIGESLNVPLVGDASASSIDVKS